MSLLDNNIKALEVYQNILFHKLNKVLKEGTYSKADHIEFVETKDGNSAISLTIEAHKYNLNSLYNPVMEAKRWANQFEFKNLNIVVSMFGFGNGLFIKEIMKKLKNEDKLFIYEPSAEIFLKVLEQYDLTDIICNGNIIIFVEGVNAEDFKLALKQYANWMNFNSQIRCNHPQYDSAFKNSYKAFLKIIQDNNNNIIVNQNTNAALSKLITKNTLNNLKYLKDCNIVTDLIGKIPQDIPAIIVAAGPSLDKNILELKKAKGKAFIFAVDTAVKYLLRNDILPDFIVTLDPKKSLHHLADPRCNHIPMFSRIEARPENLQKNTKKIIFYNIEGYSSLLLQIVGKDIGILNSGGSVTTGAFSICKTLGFQTIILVGCDLAYSGNSTHAGGISVDVNNAARYLETVEDIYGNKIETRYDWFVYIKWFEEAIELLEYGEVIDATEGGARIKGTKLLTLRESISEYCIREIDCDKIITGLSPALTRGQIKQIQDSIKGDLDDIKEIQEKVIQGIDICSRLLNKYNKSIFETESSISKNKQLTQINAFIESKQIYKLIDWDISQDTFSYLSDLYVYVENEKENKIATYERAQNLYTSITNAVDRICPMIENALCNLKE
ncbi:MAG: 6-hydroxymethylpterin diphosphokinase MptE-like protein [Anaerocolumna sp.]